jgi:hypothetical protein
MNTIITNYIQKLTIHEESDKITELIFAFAFTPACNVCYQNNKREKCRICNFILCSRCAGRMRDNKCPQCRRTNMYSYIFTNMIVRTNQWTDNPFGVIDYPNTLAPQPIDMYRCQRCLQDVCTCYNRFSEPFRSRVIWNWMRVYVHENRNCVCPLRHTTNYVCPYGENCGRMYNY